MVQAQELGTNERHNRRYREVFRFWEKLRYNLGKPVRIMSPEERQS